MNKKDNFFHCLVFAFTYNYANAESFGESTGCKINHLSYIGDAILEKNVIIGAGSITCNFDGIKNNDTYIENGAFIGSSVQLVAPVRVGENAIIGAGCQLVAPVRVGQKAMIGAGSTITKDVPAYELTVARSRQAVIKGKRPPISSN